MGDFILRLSFVILLIALYCLGPVGAIWLKEHTGVDLELKFLLPVLSLVFFDRYMRMFAKWTLGIGIKEWRLNDLELTLGVRVVHFGPGVIDLRIADVSGVKDTNVNIQWIANEQENTTDPEDFFVLLSPTKPSIYITIRYLFRDTPQAASSLRFAGRCFDIFRPLIVFRIGERTRHKRPIRIFIRRIRRKQTDAGN